MKKHEETIELTFDTRSPLSFADAVIGYLYDKNKGDERNYVVELGIVAKVLMAIYETNIELPRNNEDFPF